MSKQFIPKSTLQRLPHYLSYLKSLPAHVSTISATAIAEELGYHQVQVRKDLASVSSGGRPKVGYQTAALIYDLQRYFGRGISDNAVIVGMGPLGYALTLTCEFSAFGFRIVSAFDFDEKVIGRRCGEIEILSAHRLYDFCNAGGVRLGVIATHADLAQDVCDTLTDSGALAIWNFSSIRLKVPQDVLIFDQNLTASLAVLSAHLKQL